MYACLGTHSDVPAFEDKLGREKLVQQVAREIATCQTPVVFGIHGDWGSGKTSFLYQLEHELTGQCLHCDEASKRKPVCAIKDVFVVWFEAWRYQHEPAPVVALLHEICSQLPKYAEIGNAIKQWGNIMVQGVMGSLKEASFELQAAPGGVGPKFGLKVENLWDKFKSAADKWEADHLSKRLTTNHVRNLLSEAITQILGKETSKVCILIDDLDRCNPEAALRLLEGIKIHLALPQCAFVLGINVQQLQQAIAPLLPGAESPPDSATARAEAAEYLEKLCTFTWKLPFLPPERRTEILKLWLADPPHINRKDSTPLPSDFRDALAKASLQYDCLPANPRKIKALANTIRQLASRGCEVTDIKIGEELKTKVEDAEAILIAASIYQFHPELLRYLQSAKAAWSELILWAAEKGGLPNDSDLLKLLSSYRSKSKASATETSATPASGPRIELFADPAVLNVFRIQDLLLAATDPKRNMVDYAKMQRYLDLPS